MLSNILQKLVVFFRRKYISSLRVFTINLDVKEITQESYLDLNPQVMEQFDICIDASKELDKKYPNKKMVQKSFCLVSFDKSLSSSEAGIELSKIGFKPAHFLESVLFFSKYRDILDNYVPVISIDAYVDGSEEIGLKRNHLYDLCLLSSEKGFSRIGDCEASEMMEGATFRPNVLFLAKAI